MACQNIDCFSETDVKMTELSLDAFIIMFILNFIL